jgi:hypothetical protein
MLWWLMFLQTSATKASSFSTSEVSAAILVGQSGDEEVSTISDYDVLPRYEQLFFLEFVSIVVGYTLTILKWLRSRKGLRE